MQPFRGPPPPPRGFPGAMPPPIAGPPGVSSAPPPPGTVDIPVPIVSATAPPPPEAGPMNVFVGKLPPDLHDSYIRQLLEECGTVVTWKRTVDPVTGKPKGFGYCTFSNPSEVLRALRLLNGFFVDSREILVKVDSKTQAKLDAVASTMSEEMRAKEQERDEEIKQALQKIYEARSGRLGGQQNDVATWGELLETKAASNATTSSNSDAQTQSNGAESSHGGVDGELQEHSGSSDLNGGSGGDAPVQGERIRGTMVMKEVEKFRLAQERREQEQEQKRREAVLERLRREEEDEARRKTADEKRQVANEKRKAAEEEARMAKAEAAAARVRDRESGEESESSRGNDSDDSDGERHGSRSSRRKSSSDRRREKDRSDRGRDGKKRSSSTRERERERHDRKRSRDHRSRSRSHSHERSSRRRRSRKSTRSRSRSRTRSRSRHRDRETRDRERRKRRHRPDSSDLDDDEDAHERKKKEKKGSSKRRRDSSADRAAEHDSEREDGRRTTGKAESSPPEPPVPEPTAVKETPKIAVMPKVVLGLKMASATAKKEKPITIPTVSAFAVDDEVEAKPMRELVPIDYTEEEKLAGASVQQRVAATVQRINSRSVDVKSLIEQIPTETTELFAFPIDWHAVDKYQIVREKMAPWVKKKIVEYLGEDEPTLLEFLLTKLTQHARAVAILEELRLVLDDDAEVFVKLLWRKLAFEAVRASIG